MQQRSVKIAGHPALFIEGLNGSIGTERLHKKVWAGSVIPRRTGSGLPLGRRRKENSSHFAMTGPEGLEIASASVLLLPHPLLNCPDSVRADGADAQYVVPKDITKVASFYFSVEDFAFLQAVSGKIMLPLQERISRDRKNGLPCRREACLRLLKAAGTLVFPDFWLTLYSYGTESDTEGVRGD